MSAERTFVVIFSEGWLWWRRPVLRVFRGSGTIWRDVSTGERAGTKVEARLAAEAWRRENNLLPRSDER